MYEDRTYYALLNEAQGCVPDDIQKNAGSLVYNALSALAYEMERLYIQADFIIRQSCAATADFEHLKLKASDRGLFPNEATNARVEARFNVQVPIGARFSLKAYHYVVAEKTGADTYSLECEEAGSGPNGLLGRLTPITFVEGLETAELTGLLIPGRDEERKDEFYERYLESFRIAGFSGNVAAYKKHVNEMPGVGGCKVFPVWDGPGTVKVVVIGADWHRITDYQVAEIQQDICPDPGMGYGFAPIDHDVTVVSVEETEISVSTSITFGNGYSWEGLQDAVRDAADGYFHNIRKVWGDGSERDGATVYIARLESVILDISGVLDIQGTELNGQPHNLELSNVQVPVLKEVVNL